MKSTKYWYDELLKDNCPPEILIKQIQDDARKELLEKIREYERYITEIPST